MAFAEDVLNAVSEPRILFFKLSECIIKGLLLCPPPGDRRRGGGGPEL